MKNKKLRPPRSSKEWLDTLPKFEPDHNIPYHHIDFDGGNHTIFEPAREKRNRETLANFIADHVRSVEWNGKLTGVDRFVNNAMRAIATFEHRRGSMAKFDRQKAKDVLLGAVDKIFALSQTLEEIATDRGLSHFLEEIFLTCMSAANRPAPATKRVSARALTAALRRSAQWLESYHEISPSFTVARLMRLEPILTAAAERMEFQSGDFQRDEIAQELCNELAFSWISGTGELPTFSKPNPRLKRKSPLAELLCLVNKSILDPRYKHETDFRTYGVKARDLMRKQFPDLAVSQQPRRRL
jgi:hypothetical protein